MAELPLFGASEMAFLAALRAAGVEFLVVGLSAAALQGAPVVTRDVDLWMRDLEDERFLAVLKRFGATYVPPIGLNPPMIVGRRIAMFDVVESMHGLDGFAAEYRPKDRAVLPVLENVLRTIKEARHSELWLRWAPEFGRSRLPRRAPTRRKAHFVENLEGLLETHPLNVGDHPQARVRFSCASQDADHRYRGEA